jgi:hypothetical protein
MGTLQEIFGQSGGEFRSLPASGCQGVTAIRIGQEFHHFMERSNVELCN